MKRSIEKWAYSAGSAFIGGGAGAATLVFVHPEDIHSVSRMLEAFFIMGTVNLFFYLKQSPLPPFSETTIITKTEITNTTKTSPIEDPK